MQTTIVTSGSAYLDIDAYACCIAFAELLRKQGKPAYAYATAPCNYSVSPSLSHPGFLMRTLPKELSPSDLRYILVDVSNPAFFEDSVPLEQVEAVYDHHAGFEDFWTARIGDRAHISFIGAAATLIFDEWKRSGLLQAISRSSAALLTAGILENTLNLNSGITTARDRNAVQKLSEMFAFGDEWRATYFSEVQNGLEAGLPENALRDVKTIADTNTLPAKFIQLCVWDTDRIVSRLPELRRSFDGHFKSWMLNLVDIQRCRGNLICFDAAYQQKLAALYGIQFRNGIAAFPKMYLRKELMKIANCPG